MERNSYSTCTSNPVDHQFDDDCSSSYTSMIYLYSLGILPYSFDYAAQKLLSGSTSILQSIFFGHPQSSSSSSHSSKIDAASSNNKSSFPVVHSTHPEINDDDAVNMDEVAMVMTSLGLPPSTSDDETMTGSTRLGKRELSAIFDEREPSLDEVKAAFDVFDANCDGFIDAVELGRVLSVLGLTEGSDVQSCAQMINGVDEDGDGKIGFSEFLKFMQKSFC